jgi:very-short-patch-repair endonuclease
LSRVGVKLLRFSDREILENIEGVYEVIENAIKDNQK